MNNIPISPLRGLPFRLVQLRMFLTLYRVGLKRYGNPLTAWKGLVALLRHGAKVSGHRPVRKAFRIGNQYGWDMFHPLYPSPAFDRFFSHHFEEVLPSKRGGGVLRRLLVAITKKCPLQCAHCSEWDTLNQPDVLTVEQLHQKISAMVAYGVSQLVYSGGEPLSRFEDLLTLIRAFRGNTSQWVYTSGLGLNRQKADQLVAAGLEGVAISLDHHDPQAHNDFRGSPKSFHWVQEAVQHCLEAGLVVGINVCPSREYIRSGGLEAFMDLMKAWHVPVVNVLEPRAVGHYAGKDVLLRPAETAEIERLFLQYNFDPAYDTWPIMTWPGLARKSLRCGGGVSYLLLDYDGTLRPCPFCKTPVASFETAQPALCEA